MTTVLFPQLEQYNRIENMRIRCLPENYTVDHTKKRRRVIEEDEVGSTTDPIYCCSDCGKKYKHPNCLTKHQWEHSEQWEYTSKFLLTKHQQVQMLEAASILMNMKSSSTKPLTIRN